MIFESKRRIRIFPGVYVPTHDACLLAQDDCLCVVLRRATRKIDVQRPPRRTLVLFHLPPTLLPLSPSAGPGSSNTCGPELAHTGGAVSLATRVVILRALFDLSCEVPQV